MKLFLVPQKSKLFVRIPIIIAVHDQSANFLKTIHFVAKVIPMRLGVAPMGPPPTELIISMIGIGVLPSKFGHATATRR